MIYMSFPLSFGAYLFGSSPQTEGSEFHESFRNKLVQNNPLKLYLLLHTEFKVYTSCYLILIDLDTGVSS